MDTTVRGTVSEWIGLPLVPWRLTVTLYVPAVALLGIVTVAVTGTDAPLLKLIGLAGLSVHCAPEIALASQVAVTCPL